jgi:hypothetical protein
MNPRPTYEVHIEELVLHGIAPGDEYAIRDAVEGEITRLLSGHGAPATESVASQVGRAIYQEVWGKGEI